MHSCDIVVDDETLCRYFQPTERACSWNTYPLPTLSSVGPNYLQRTYCSLLTSLEHWCWHSGTLTCCYGTLQEFHATIRESFLLIWLTLPMTCCAACAGRCCIIPHGDWICHHVTFMCSASSRECWWAINSWWSKTSRLQWSQQLR